MQTTANTEEILILEDGQAPPPGTVTAPRQPKWYDTFNYIADPEKFCRQNLQEYGPIFKTNFFGRTNIFVGSAKAVQMAFNGDLKYTEIALPATMMDMFGEYSLFQRPDLHRQRKNALAPGLTGRLLDEYTPYTNDAIARGLQTWVSPGKIALYPAVEKICFDVLVPLLLGVRLHDSDSETFAGLPLSSKAELKALYKTYFDGFYGLSKWKSSLTKYGRGLKARDALIDFMRAVIRRRQAEDKSNTTTDFLGMMLASQQQNPEGVFSNAFIENQCLLQLWASLYEITALVSSFIYQVAEYPQVIQHLREEQANIVGNQSNFSGFSPDNLRQMVFLEATIKETLRQLPPSGTASRLLTKSVVLDGMLYEKGCVLMAEPRIAHIMPEHFHQPEVFAPERFLPERGEGKMYEFFPFGGGVHACLGAQMAIAVTKVFTSHVLRLFDWQLTGKAKFIQFPLKRIKDDYQIDIINRN
ncbi:cytochrome P450 [Nostoc sp. CENA67]|uniref:Cytochrome P450 n=1 Tax=Amazonocrinis nigriterrae CENA67 TaxID=2794033 RepID=A0A8J7HVS8_9NOST|nr:cytochrome P450 [Amazonocrinis nigriterrae]MBH8563544.1 cytochrome P450 [Amazonocrinis nigriterrae CENA67]